MSISTMKNKFSARLGNYWLVLMHAEGNTWRMQLWGESCLEAEVTAVDEEAAKEAALSAAIARLHTEDPEFREPANITWNPVFTSAQRLPPE